VTELGKPTTVTDINAAFKAAAGGRMQGILQYCEAPLVSSDFRGSPFSSILDALSTMVISGSMVKVLAWYDNEWGYSCRLGDLATYIAGKGL
jgi:glyceraldehyde 3-phosphate dehydrogenase